MPEIDNNTRALAEEIGRAVAAQIADQWARAERPVPTEYLTVNQVTQMTGFSAKSLEALRSRREGPRFLKVGASVRYRVADVRAWIEGNSNA